MFLMTWYEQTQARLLNAQSYVAQLPPIHLQKTIMYMSETSLDHLAALWPPQLTTYRSEHSQEQPSQLRPELLNQLTK